MSSGTRGWLRTVTALLLVPGAALLSSCSGDAGDGALPAWLASTREPVVLVIGVVDLRASDLPDLPALGDAFAGGTRWTDALSSGAGAAAALALVDGRSPLDHLRAPGDASAVARQVGWDAAVLEVAATLRSEPEWVDAQLHEVPVRTARSDLPSLDALPEGRVWRVLLLDPFSREDAPLRPRPGDRDAAGSAWIETVLTPWIAAQRGGPLADRLHVVLTGIPRAPARDQRTRALPPGGPLPAVLHVPLAWVGPKGSATEIESPVLLHEHISTSLGTLAPPVVPRWSAWWSDFSGGMYVELPSTSTLPAARAWIDETGRWTAVDGQADALRQREPEFDATSLALSFGPGTRPRLWCALRGSEEVDFVDLTFVGDGLDSTLTGWALEDIDLVRPPAGRVRTLALAAETRGDGALIDLAWPPRPLEVRVSSELLDSGFVGVSYFAGQRAHAVSVGNLRLAPFTRVFWRAASGSWPDHADAWWPDAAVGVHLIVSTQSEIPAPASWEE